MSIRMSGHMSGPKSITPISHHPSTTHSPIPHRTADDDLCRLHTSPMHRLYIAYLHRPYTSPTCIGCTHGPWLSAADTSAVDIGPTSRRGIPTAVHQPCHTPLPFHAALPHSAASAILSLSPRRQVVWWLRFFLAPINIQRVHIELVVAMHSRLDAMMH